MMNNYSENNGTYTQNDSCDYIGSTIEWAVASISNELGSSGKGHVHSVIIAPIKLPDGIGPANLHCINQ